MAMINNSSLLQLLTKDLILLRITPAITQIRGVANTNKQKLRNPFWFVRKNRVLHEDHVTPENKTFIQDVIKDQYGPPAIIKGVPTYTNAAKSSIVNVSELEKREWSPNLKRTGVLARKIGQYPLWLKNGERVRTTLLHVVDNHVIKYIPPEKYDPPRKDVKNSQKPKKLGCLLVGAESADPSLLTKEYCGLFKDSGVMPKKHIGRFFVSPEAALPSGTPLNATHFRVGDVVDVRGRTIDRGFQGVVVRWGFKGMPASHGVTKTHRRPGNIGGGGEKGRVWPGTKMPGHMGNRWRILRGLKIWRINTKYNVIWVQGSCIAGDTNSLVYIYDTLLPFKRPKLAPPFPTSFDDELEESLPEDIWFDEVHNFKEPSIEFKEEVKT